MELPTFAALAALAQVVIVDLVLAGDNAVVIGIAVAGLPREQRTRALLMGIAVATVMRILFASITVQLLEIIGLLLAGGLLLLWVSWKLWREIREAHDQRAAARREPIPGVAQNALPDLSVAGTKTMRQAAVQIVLADVSMSLDNVLAVAGVSGGHVWVLAVGLALSIGLMAFAALLIARLLARYHWIAYVGLALIFYVAVRMIYAGGLEIWAAAGDIAPV